MNSMGTNHIAALIAHIAHICPSPQVGQVAVALITALVVSALNSVRNSAWEHCHVVSVRIYAAALRGCHADHRGCLGAALVGMSPK